MYCPKDLPVGRSVEEEDNNDDGTDPVCAINPDYCVIMS